METLVVLLIALVIVGAVGALVWAIVAWSAQFHKRIDEAWVRAAKELGGRFTPVHGPWYNRKARNLQATVDDVPVLVDHYTVSRGKSSVTYTRVRCGAAAPRGMELQAYRKHALSGLGQALGFQDVPTGHGAFDEAFTVKSNVAALVPIWVGSPVRRHLGQVTRYGFSLANGEVKAQRTGLEDDAEALTTAVRSAALLGGRGRRVLEAWRSMAAELGGSLKASHRQWEPGADTSIQAPWHDVPITIDVITQRAGLLGNDVVMLTRVRGRRGRGERFLLGEGEPPAGLSPVATSDPSRWPAFSSDPKRTAQRLTQTQLKALSGLGVVRVEAGDDHITLLLHGVLADPTRAAAAVDVVGRLCSDEHLGPYR